MDDLEWIFDNLQKLEGVPLTEHNVSIIFMALIKLKELYHTLEKEGNDGEGEGKTENRTPADPG